MPKKILIVDDSLTSVMWQQLVLKQEPYEIVVANDGQAGVEAAVASRPDLILMDMVMPRMNGLEALRAIRATRGLASVPVIMVTTRSEMKNIEAAFASGCTEYITKPIDRTELLGKVRAHLGAASAVA
ncbi:MAG: response regulator [Gemmatimonadaceae bacterium]|nr:response regulator [Gemmatimonadaceae bacterium]NUQ94741.1 response regulator [Gemmatimonadaceae bacterium]NUR18092.1 response regulator [Gemmatimonadaceae bacterium]NUS95960.1 response regulator [Gemmatimonadaceae bacterium]